MFLSSGWHVLEDFRLGVLWQSCFFFPSDPAVSSHLSDRKRKKFDSLAMLGRFETQAYSCHNWPVEIPTTTLTKQ